MTTFTSVKDLSTSSVMMVDGADRWDSKLTVRHTNHEPTKLVLRLSNTVILKLVF